MVTKVTRVPAQKRAPRKSAVKNGFKTAPRKVVVEAAKDWSMEVLRCRLQTHSWQQYSIDYDSYYHYYHVVSRCDRGCGVEKWEEWDDEGNVGGKVMVYPKDENGNPTYLLEGFGRIMGEAKGALRIELAKRLGINKSKSNPADPDKDMPPRSGKTVSLLMERGQWVG